MIIPKRENAFNTDYFCDGCIFLKKEKTLTDRTAMICASGEKAPSAILLQCRDEYINRTHPARPKWCSGKITEGTI